MCKLILKKTNVETLMIKNVFDFEYDIYIYIYIYIYNQIVAISEEHDKDDGVE